MTKALGHSSSIAAAALAAAYAIGMATGVAAHATTFSVAIENVATDKTLQLPDGSAAGAPIAPGAYAVIRDGAMMFDKGGSAGMTGLEALAEDGNAEGLIATFKKMKGVREAGMFIPGQPFDVTAQPGDRLVFSSMFVQSNDKFYSPDPRGIDLFDTAKMPMSGDLTTMVMLWDAGTEKDEAPGVGPNQAPRQSAPNTGPAEDGFVGLARSEERRVGKECRL